MQNILSGGNIKDEVFKSISKLPFFSDYKTHDSIVHASEEQISNWFKVDSDNNLEFLKLTNYVDYNDNVNVNWSNIRNWLVSDIHSDENILKYFIRS